MAIKTLLVEKESYISKKTGKENFSYFVKGVIKGKEVKAILAPPDFGGYTVLDIVFASSDKAELKVNPFEIKDEATGKVISGNTYAVQTVDEDGEIFEYKVKPFKSSDKTLLEMLLKQIQ
ncbi:MAG TPA: hypothetical protein PKV66_01290 [Candidatus Pelethenecus sp.]|nr:hypothetical protein [Candidatus Pelethenecus sp.]